MTEPTKPANLENAETSLKGFMEHYKTLSESEKFSLAKMFNTETGGKLSPYNSPQPVAVALIPVFNPNNGDHWVIVGRRNIAPKIGELALPGGFFEKNEHGADAAKREVFEEIGLDLNPNKFIAFHKVLTSPTNNSLVFMLYTEGLPLTVEQVTELMKKSGTPNETSEIAFYNPKHDEMLAFPFHEEAVKAYFNMDGYTLDKTVQWADAYVPYTEQQRLDAEKEATASKNGFRMK